MNRCGAVVEPWRRNTRIGIRLVGEVEKFGDLCSLVLRKLTIQRLDLVQVMDCLRFPEVPRQGDSVMVSVLHLVLGLTIK